MSFSRAALITAAVALASPAFAQDWKGMGRLSGKVLDPDGKPLADVTVKLELPARGGGTTVKTNKKGEWALLGIAAGAWNVDFEAAGFTPKKISITLPGEGTRLPPVEVRLERAAPKGPPPEVLEAVQKGDEAYKAGRFAEARVEYEKLLTLRPDLATTLHIQIARCYKEEMNQVTMEKYEQLQEGMSYQQVVEILGSSGEEAASGGGVEIHKWSNPSGGTLSATFQQRKLSVKAQSGLQETPRTGLRSRKEFVEKELEHLQKILDLDPENSEIKTLMAMEAVGEGLLERGLQILETLDQSKVASPDVFFNIGVGFRNKDKPDAAVAYFSKAVALDPTYVDGYFQRALTFFGLQKFAEAKADFKKVLELSPEGPQAETAKKVIEQLK